VNGWTEEKHDGQGDRVVTTLMLIADQNFEIGAGYVFDHEANATI
jgi:hypothetical protein